VAPLGVAFAVAGADLVADLDLHQRLRQHPHTLTQKVHPSVVGVARKLHQFHLGDRHRVLLET
jgi:hypothetical protein